MQCKESPCTFFPCDAMRPCPHRPQSHTPDTTPVCSCRPFCFSSSCPNWLCLSRSGTYLTYRYRPLEKPEFLTTHPFRFRNGIHGSLDPSILIPTAAAVPVQVHPSPCLPVSPCDHCAVLQGTTANPRMHACISVPRSILFSSLLPSSHVIIPCRPARDY